MPTTQFKQGEVDCLLVNTTGELRFFYEYATVVFIGKSLTAEAAGQNPIEAGRIRQSHSVRPKYAKFYGHRAPIH